MLTLALVLLPSAWAGDKDKDGVPNKTDECKKEPEDADGFEDEDGCPDPDNDGDALLDAEDECPDEKEDVDEFEDEDGCPDPDNDGDGVLDADDQCPDELENDDTKDGCPAVTIALLNEDGMSPAIKTLADGMSDALGQGADGCGAAVSTAESWMGEHDPDALMMVYEARLARAPEDVNVQPTKDLLKAQADFWVNAKAAFDIYCKDDPKWPGLSAKVDGVFSGLGGGTAE